MLRQFKMAVEAALAGNQETRTMVRARYLLQRFPVAQWMEDLEIWQSTSVKLHDRTKLLAAKRTPLRTIKRGIADVMDVVTLLLHNVSNVISKQTHATKLALQPVRRQNSAEGPIE